MSEELEFDHEKFLRKIALEISSVVGVFVGGIMTTCAEYCLDKKKYDVKNFKKCIEECSEKIVEKI